MKPLELRIFPPFRDDLPFAEFTEIDWKMWRKRGVSKRFSDAELAAEYWRALADADKEFWAEHEQVNERAEEILGTLKRFVTLPNYWEEET